MIELSKLTESDVGRRLHWMDVYLHEGLLVTWGTKLLIVDEEVIGGRGSKSLRVFVDPDEASFVDETK